ncbi:MAG: hypothetical protein GKS05_03395 [Nitrospirales bacterium]|nr:hypothetical protein [Nitrospirales bacterium]
MTCLFSRQRLFLFIFLLVTLSFGVTPGLAQETDQEVPVVLVDGEVRADLCTGTTTTSIPIEVSPDREGAPN